MLMRAHKVLQTQAFSDQSATRTFCRGDTRSYGCRVSRHSSPHSASFLPSSAATYCAALGGCFPLCGPIEVDESYFGGRRKGKRGRGAAGKVPVFGTLQRGGRVYTQIIPDAKRKTLLPIMEARIVPDSIVYSDALPSYNALDVTAFHHFRINHSKSFVKGQTHINGIENFWNQAKRYLRKYNGIPRQHFNLFLKECEWRFNAPSPQIMLKELKAWLKKENK